MLHGCIRLAVWHDWHSGRLTFRHGAGQTDKASDFYIYILILILRSPCSISWYWKVRSSADPVLGSQPAGYDSMHSHEPGGRLPPPPTRPTATHMHSHEPGGRLPPPPTRPTATHMHSHETDCRLRMPLFSARPAVTSPAIRRHCIIYASS